MNYHHRWQDDPARLPPMGAPPSGAVTSGPCAAFTVSVADKIGHAPAFGHNRDLGAFAIVVTQHAAETALRDQGGGVAHERFWLASIQDVRPVTCSECSLWTRPSPTM